MLWPAALLCKSALGSWGPAQRGSCPSPSVPPSKVAAWAWSLWVPEPGLSMPSTSSGGALGLWCPAFSAPRRWRLCPSHSDPDTCPLHGSATFISRLLLPEGSQSIAHGLWGCGWLRVSPGGGWRPKGGGREPRSPRACPHAQPGCRGGPYPQKCLPALCSASTDLSGFIRVLFSWSSHLHRLREGQAWPPGVCRA